MEALRGSCLAAAPATIASTPEPAPLWRRIAPVGAAVVVTALVTTAVWWSLAPAEGAPELVKFRAPADVTSLPVGRDIAVSPDGQLIIYQAPGGPAVRAMDELEGVVIDGGEIGGGPFFSADSAWIGFVDGTTGGIY